MRPNGVLTASKIEALTGAKIWRGWHCEGAGPARFGYWRLHPCKREWLGKTLELAAHALGVTCNEAGNWRRGLLCSK